MRLRRFVVAPLVAALAAPAAAGLAPPAGAAIPTDVFFSEYVEGSGFNKAIEIFNGTGAPIDLAAGGYTLELYSNGAPAPTQTVALAGTAADGDVFVVSRSDADPALAAQADQLAP
ncbi:MAG: lamin tail domain-containing protein, partial [Candidatus Limnocylindrales bacterium]